VAKVKQLHFIPMDFIEPHFDFTAMVIVIGLPPIHFQANG